MFLHSVFFIEIIVAKPKVNIHSKIQSYPQVRSNFFLSYSPFVLLHSGFSSLLKITTALHAGKYPDVSTGNLPYLTSYRSLTSLKPLRPSTEISRQSCSSVVTTSKKRSDRPRNSSVVESQGQILRFGSASFSPPSNYSH